MSSINGYDNSLPSPGSLWLYSSGDRTRENVPPKDPVDVLVIGAGIAGICAAYNLSRNGLAVGLIDARNVLTGTTGYTTAKLSIQHELRYSKLYDRSRNIAEVYAGAQTRGEKWLRHELAALRIDSDLMPTSTVLYTTEESTLSQLQREVEIAQELGMPAQYWEELDLGYLVDGVKGYYEMQEQAVFHPVKAMNGLLKVFLEKNWLAEGVRALEVKEAGGRCVVSTNAGTIYADKVVITTHVPFNDKGKYTKKMVPTGEMVVAGPISGLTDIHASLSVDKNKTNFSARTARGPGGHRYGVVLGYEHRPGTVKDLFSQHKALAAHALENVRLDAITFRWYAHDYTTVDEVPFIGYYNDDSDKILMATGFGLWGMTNGAYSGLLLSEMIMGSANEEEVATFDPSRSNFNKKFVSNLFEMAREYVSGKVDGGSDSIEDLEPNQAVVGNYTATYQDPAGENHSISSTCTHLGCTVAFNNTDNTWDCPCHASRYDINGGILHGPAVFDLRADER